MIRLDITSPDSKTRTVQFSQRRLSFGRSESADVRISDKTVSRMHAAITVEDGKAFLGDLHSRTGTFLNGRQILDNEALSSGDIIKMGETEVSVAALEFEPNAESKPERKPAVGASPNTSALPVYKGGASTENFYGRDMLKLSRKIQDKVLELLNLSDSDTKDMTTAEMLPKVNAAIDRVLLEMHHEIPAGTNVADFRQMLLDELIGIGPISPLLRDPNVSEIMVNGAENIFVESRGLQYRAREKFSSEAHLQSIIQRIVEPIGRHVDAASPMVDARLEDGSRVNVVIPPLALDGSLLTIRKFPEKKLTTDDLIKFGSMTCPMAEFLREAVRAKRNILVSGGTGSGKTTLLNIMSFFIPENERIITVEDSAELKLSHENLCRLEARPANTEGQGRVSIRDLVINTLRMRPDRIIVGECRGAEALDMLQAMNTGHDGSMTTCHANNPRDALARLENMVMMAGYDLPSTAIREQIASAINIIVQQTRLPDGSRKIVNISEVTGREGGTILMQDIFEFKQKGFDENFHIVGYHTATGNIPRFVDELRRAGDLELDMSVFVPTEGESDE